MCVEVRCRGWALRRTWLVNRKQIYLSKKFLSWRRVIESRGQIRKTIEKRNKNKISSPLFCRFDSPIYVQKDSALALPVGEYLLKNDSWCRPGWLTLRWGWCACWPWTGLGTLCLTKLWLRLGKFSTTINQSFVLLTNESQVVSKLRVYWPIRAR